MKFKRPKEQVIEAAIELLKLDFEHGKKVAVLEDVLRSELGYLHVNIFDAVLRLLGVPDDNTIELGKKYHPEILQVHPDTFCHDLITNTWLDVKTGSEQEIRQFLEWLFQVMEEENFN